MSQRIQSILFLVTVFAWLAGIQSASGQQTFSDFAANIPKENTEVVAVNDIARHLQSILENQALERVLTRGPLADHAMLLGLNWDPESGLEWLEENRDYFPKTIALGSSDDLYTVLGNVFEILLRINMSAHASQSGSDYDERNIDKIQDELLQILKASSLPHTTLWLKWPAEEAASETFALLAGQLDAMFMDTDLSIERKKESIEISGSVGDLLDASGIRLYLSFFGLPDRERKLTEALVDYKLFFKASVNGSGLKISIGKDSTSGEMSTAKDLPGIKNGSDQIFYGKWDVTKLHQASDKIEASVKRWMKTDVGKIMLEQDPEDTVQGFLDTAAQFRLAARTGTMRSWAEKGKVKLQMDQQGLSEASDLKASPILKMVPANAETYAVSSTRSLADFFVACIDYYENQLATRELQGELGNDRTSAELAEIMLSGYYRFFKEPRQTLRKELPKLDSNPFAVIVNTTGKLDSVAVDFEGLNEPIEIEVENFMQMAFVAHSKDAKAIKEGLLKSYQQIVAGVFQAAEVDFSGNEKLTSKLDLGSGVVADEMSLDWIGDADIANFEIKGDFQPHVFVRGDYVVLSTSKKLSVKLLSDLAKLKLKHDTGEAIVEYGKIRGRTLGNLYQSLLVSMSQIIGQQLGVDAPMMDLSRGIGELVSVMESCDWVTTQEEKNRRTTYVLEFQTR